MLPVPRYPRWLSPMCTYLHGAIQVQTVMIWTVQLPCCRLCPDMLTAVPQHTVLWSEQQRNAAQRDSAMSRLL